MNPVWILVAHIAVLGYWLGSELVINSTYRYVSYSRSMPFDERARLMEHVMHVDQHVRYALVLQAMLGTMLAAAYGLVPGGDMLLWAALGAGLVWLGFVEAVHRLRHAPLGKRLGAIDRGSRYVLMALLLALAFGVLGGGWGMPLWLRLKLGLFAGVMACGVGIRFALIAHFRTWAEMARDGVTDVRNRVIEQTYVRATLVLLLLWVFIAAIVVVSVVKPA
ncbi:hypothetical protein ACUJ46_07815 [Sandaracinobacteroides sp. A072]|uniref:hypothetical protein n=1 Tax=Sandaracinobacteroides sp. A072 TaxID=3461146 RepID=UPI004042CFA6